MARETWTDERLDDLAKRVDEGFRESRADLRLFRQEVDARFDKVDARFDKVDARFERLEERFDSLQRVLIGGMLVFILSAVLTRI